MIDPLTGYVRAKAICLSSTMVGCWPSTVTTRTKQQRFWVPVGGRVEFGELSSDAIVREVREELSTEITDLELLGVLESIFTFDGRKGHEIVFVYDAKFVDGSMYQRIEINGVEGDDQFTAHWINPNSPKHGWPLYPEGITGLLSN